MNSIFDFIQYYSIEVTYCDYNDLFGPTHPELGFIIYTCYFFSKKTKLFK